MKRAIIHACSQAFQVLLAIQFYGTAAFWNFDVFQGKDASIDTIINNRSLKSIPEDTEPGFNFNDNEMRLLKLWSRGIIPYYIDTVSYGKGFRDKLRLFLESVNRLSGMQFVELYKPPPDGQTRWVFFSNRQRLLTTGGCTTEHFTNEGVQTVSLGYESLSNGDLFEFVLAVAGIPPQNNEPWRDEYIEIMEQNILDEKKHLFELVNYKEWLFHDLKYDFTSAGHFDFHKYSKNGMATIHPKAGIPDTQGRGKGFSFNDILKLRMLYNFIANKETKPAIEICQKMFKIGPKFGRFPLQTNLTTRKPRKKHTLYSPFSNESISGPFEYSDESIEYDDIRSHESEVNSELTNETTQEKKSKQRLSLKKAKVMKQRWIKG